MGATLVLTGATLPPFVLRSFSVPILIAWWTANIAGACHLLLWKLCLFYSFHFHFEMWDLLLLLSCSSGILDLKLERLLYDGFIYLINGLWCCLGNADIFERETPSNWQTKVQQLGLMKQRNEGQLILPSVAFPVAMTAGEVYLKIPDSESLFVLSPSWAFEAVPTV